MMCVLALIFPQIVRSNNLYLLVNVKALILLSNLLTLEANIYLKHTFDKQLQKIDFMN